MSVTVFDAQTKNIANGHKRLLIVDGHSSHFSVAVQLWMCWGSLSSRGDMPKSLMIGPETPVAP